MIALWNSRNKITATISESKSTLKAKRGHKTNLTNFYFVVTLANS